MIVLGIESSCDETAAAVLKDGKIVLSSVIASQIDIHHKYGGVVPELASRMHIEAIGPVVEEAIGKAGITLDDIGGVAVTQGPGLVGALLVGFSFAKAFAWARGLPWTGVNHLEGHLYSVLLNDPPPKFPFTALLASGGHTSIYYVTSFNDFQPMGQTRDDAAGEAFDKVAKILGLGYPGGAVIEKFAAKGDPESIVFPRPLLDRDDADFSFSGLKSAVARYVQEKGNSLTQKQVADVAAGFQAAVLDVLSSKLIKTALAKGCNTIAVTGGVAANQALLKKISRDACRSCLEFHHPPSSLCGDNAVMIAARGHRLIADGRVSQLDDDVYSRTRMIL